MILHYIYAPFNMSLLLPLCNGSFWCGMRHGTSSTHRTSWCGSGGTGCGARLSAIWERRPKRASMCATSNASGHFRATATSAWRLPSLKAWRKRSLARSGRDGFSDGRSAGHGGALTYVFLISEPLSSVHRIHIYIYNGPAVVVGECK